MTDTHLGQISTEAAAEGDTGGSFEGTMTVEFTHDRFHLLNRPLFGLINLSDPALSFTFSTQYHWQARFGWTLVQRSWPALGSHLEFSIEQGITRQFGQDSRESAWIVDFLQGGVKYPIARSNIYLLGEVGFSGERKDDGTWGAAFTGALGVGIELEAIFRRGSH